MSTVRWPQVRLGEVLTKKIDRIDLDPDVDYRQVTVRMWGGGVGLRRIVKGSGIAASSQIKVQAGQFIVSKIDARHGAFGIVPELLDGAVVSQDFPVFEVNEKSLLPGFLGWMSKTDWFVDLCRVSSEGSTNRVRLREDRFLNHVIPLPPVPEQLRIIQGLNVIAAGVEARAHAASAVDADLDASLKKAFEKVTSGAPRLLMSDVAPLARRTVEIDLEGAYPELGVRSFGKGTFHKPVLSGFEIGTKRLFRIEKGDLLFNIVFAWEGAVAVATAEDDGRVGSHRFLTCVPNPTLATSEFLRYFFLTTNGLELIGKASPGGAGRNRTLGLEALNAIEVPVPPLEKQQWFDQLQSKAANARRRSADAASELDHLIPAILNQVL
jgi:type I restriction enzyme S subunit